MKKLIALILALVLAFSLAACGTTPSTTPAPAENDKADEGTNEAAEVSEGGLDYSEPYEMTVFSISTTFPDET